MSDLTDRLVNRINELEARLARLESSDRKLGDIQLTLGDTAGTNKLTLRNSTPTEVFRVTSQGNLVVTGDLSGASLTVTQQAWQAPTFVNSWVNYGSPYENAGYFKDSLGMVHMRGLVKNGTVGAAIFTLPAGYRPEQERIYATMGGGAFGEVRIQTTGIVLHMSGGNAYFSLAVPPFRAYA